MGFLTPSQCMNTWVHWVNRPQRVGAVFRAINTEGIADNAVNDSGICTNRSSELEEAGGVVD